LGYDDLNPVLERTRSTNVGRRIWLLVFLSVLIALVFARAIFRDFSYWGVQDWDQHFFYHDVPRRTLIEYHQFPLWNPYYCGGTVMLANPQSRLLAPSFPLILLFGAVKGIKLEIPLHLIIGLLGMYLLARRYKMGVWTAALPAFVYMLSSMYALNLSVGMTWFLSVAYLPWAFLFYLLGFERYRYTFLSGLFLTLIYFGGGAYTLSIVMLFFALFSLLSIPQRGIRRVAKSFIILLVFTLCLGAVKFLPSIAFLRQHPRHISDYSGYSVKILTHSLFDRDQSLAAFHKYARSEGFWSGMSYGIDENGMYIGFIPFLLFLLGIAMCWKRHWRLGICFLVFLWLSLGNRVPFSLWRLLHALPIYNSMRVAQRFRIVFMFCLALFAGFGLQWLLDLLNREKKNRKYLLPLTLLVPIVVLAVLADLTLVNSPVFEDAFTIPPLSVEKREDFSQISRLNNYDANGFLAENSSNTDGSWSALYPPFLANLGTVDGYETAIVPRNAIPEDSDAYKGEAFFQGTSGELSIDYWSPNRVTVSIRPDKAGYLALNQNYYTGWKVRGPRSPELWQSGPLLAAKVTPEDQVVEFYYSPISFKIGLVITCLALLVGVLVWVRKRKLEYEPETLE